MHEFKELVQATVALSGYLFGLLMWECGLESDEMTSVLVDDNGQPFDFRPMWCRYDKEVDV